MFERRKRSWQFTIAVCALVAVLSTSACRDGASGPPAATYPNAPLELVAPAAAGGGWDLTARSMQQALVGAGLVKGEVKVENVLGAGGVIGLSQLVTTHRRDPHHLMVTGLVMVGAAVVNESPVDLAAATPIATLTAEAEAIVVPASSPYVNLRQLLDAWKANPTSVKWGGGSTGGTDHILVGLLAKLVGVGARKVEYVGHSGGGEIKSGLTKGDFTVAVSGVSEFKDLIAGGKARALAVSSATSINIAGRPVPTIGSSGYNLELMNWRGVLAPPGITEAQRAAMVKLVDQMHDTPQWKQILADQGWTDLYRSGSDAATYFRSETERIKGVLVDLGMAP
ncbi:tripartite tricarboxylate transporter substrate binding protein [Dactylosporangium roseum]|uniref:Tripartite tricarboxylate transporter substrate binding protein n=1 Tax=Dactylosporangium roseum TaxID=47989 RepID=A0ABY5Z7D4_9ACTN|nr:tripartite tricarboxylate transporter substrate-binding protein [Dactylosporangium roseum]UWZ37975.1 tripartite tricarboxylate transporter substrate binding protein [Dactylosporangium roseum]